MPQADLLPGTLNAQTERWEASAGAVNTALRAREA